jgi:protein-S-isoprenylcysteine O-methyltransferase Ste14
VTDPLYAGLGLALFAGHSSYELWLREHPARSLRRGPADRGSTLVTTAAGLAASLGSLAGAALGPLPWLPIPRPALAGFVVLLAGGAALRFWAMRCLGASFTRTLETRPGQRVVSRGPYARVRHPGYLAQLLAFPAFAALLVQSWLAPLAAAALLAGAYAYRIPVEERMLAGALGAEWRAYRERTWALLPGLV